MHAHGSSPGSEGGPGFYRSAALGLQGYSPSASGRSKGGALVVGAGHIQAELVVLPGPCSTLGIDTWGSFTRVCQPEPD